jgi:hypothetical protein
LTDKGIKNNYVSIDLKPACNNYGKCFMTIGAIRENCQENFRKDIIATCRKQANVPAVCIATLVNLYDAGTSIAGSVLHAWTSSQAKAHDYERTLEKYKMNIIGNISDRSGAISLHICSSRWHCLGN